MYTALEKKLGYSFQSIKFLEHALTHRSYRYEDKRMDQDNQRLEFLGDAALGFVSANYLFTRFPDSQEGDLTRFRSRMANTQTLAQIASEIELGSFLRLGRGEQQSGGIHRTSNLADTLESILGAAFLDGELAAVQIIFETLFIPYFEKVPLVSLEDNPKGTLQETVQKQWKISPEYRLVREEGSAHSKQFTVEVLVKGEVLGQGTGTNKRLAEIEAAQEAFKQLQRMNESRT
ncbi:MAG: ribonuclease III [Kiritimatiellae bacterium]|nr:ribonuclease III [Kiritimatiellia bacterium]